jgi:DNA uptake protein ComE-like DNA-binding protein
MVILFSRPLYSSFTRHHPKDFSRENVKLDSLVSILQAKNSEKDTLNKVNLFAFDPNTANSDQLKSLGFKTEIVTRMINYRKKGGTFQVKSDVLKIYGMDSILYENIYPFIALPSKKNTGKQASQPEKKIKAKLDSLFDLNNVDSTRLLNVYGIGPVLSSRIIRFREKLGGFIHQSQLYEIYGLDSVVVDRISGLSFIGKDFKPRKINLNDSNTEKALSAHPYLSKAEAKAIVAYRFQHGTFAAVSDLRKIQIISERTFLKIEPYLTAE